MFLVLSFGATFLWLKVGLPFFYPEMLEKQARQQAQQQIAELDEKQSNDKADAAGDADADSAAKPTADSDGESADEPKQEAVELPDYPDRLITLGSLKTDANTFLQVDLTSRGAAIATVQLNDPRYRELTDREQPLQLVGPAPKGSQLTFDLKIDEVNRQLLEQRTSLDRVNWQVDEETLTDRLVTFTYPSPDGTLELRKTYQLQEGNPDDRNADTPGYCLNVSLEFRNLSDKPQMLVYNLQGPVGFPLEEAENTRRFLALQAGFVRGNSVNHEQVSAQEIAEQAEEESGIDSLQAPVRYVGIDGQYFAALLIPDENQEDENWIAQTQPQLTKRGTDEQSSLISLTLVSNPVELPANGAVTHTYTLYTGPKRTSLLRPFDADAIIEYGWFGAISKLMLAIMNFFHNTLYLPYGLAIVMLTVIVRGAMYPISRKHALAAKKMKEMQPRIEEIRKKYENDKEKLAKAQMEIMKESGFFSGCLPMLLQLPIFIGLYQALYVSVDLRMAEFLWINNLAAPDRLFQMPFSLPFLGNDFNLLPMLTVALFVMQQKMFAPPPANEEQALQQKMMGYMMIFIGVMFYRVPAGLCIYFIASSLWAICERKILDLHDTATSGDSKTETPAVVKATAATKATGGKAAEEPKKPTWFQNLMSELDSAANPANKGAQPSNRTGGNKNARGRKKR